MTRSGARPVVTVTALAGVSVVRSPATEGRNLYRLRYLVAPGPGFALGPFSCVDARMSAVRGEADVPGAWS